MNLRWFMNLFIFVLFSLFSFNKGYSYYDDNEENENMNNLIKLSITTKYSILDQSQENIYEDYHQKYKTKTTKHSSHSPNEYYDEHDNDNEDEDEEEKTSSAIATTTTLLSSSTSNREKLISNIVNQTITNKNEIELTSSIRSHFTHKIVFWTTTIDTDKLIIYATKTNRDRLFLKIFTITVTIGMSALVIVLITIHIIQKSKPYHGYRTPNNNNISNEQSKHYNNIYI